MSDLNKEFDYQSILETCELQGESAKRALDEKNQSDASYKSALDKVKKFRKEWEEKNATMFDISLTQKKNLQKLEETMNRQSIVNKEISSIQLEIASLNSDLQKQSDDSIRKTEEMNQNLRQLYTHFDEKVLETAIAEVSNELLASQDIEVHLENELKKFEKTRSELTNAYARSGILKILQKKLSENTGAETVEDTRRKIAEKIKNIHFLTNQLEKMSETLR